jgi:NADP-dependent 3-hydroxy acid dehydrogenase YdfG
MDDFTEKFNDEIKAAYEVTRAVLPDMINQNYVVKAADRRRCRL